VIDRVWTPNHRGIAVGVDDDLPACDVAWVVAHEVERSCRSVAAVAGVSPGIVLRDVAPSVVIRIDELRVWGRGDVRNGPVERHGQRSPVYLRAAFDPRAITCSAARDGELPDGDVIGKPNDDVQV